MTSLDKHYRPNLVKFWNYFHHTNYKKQHTFTQDELLTITSDQLYSYFANKVYGIPNPTDGDKPDKRQIVKHRIRKEGNFVLHA